MYKYAGTGLTYTHPLQFYQPNPPFQETGPALAIQLGSLGYLTTFVPYISVSPIYNWVIFFVLAFIGDSPILRDNLLHSQSFKPFDSLIYFGLLQHLEDVWFCTVNRLEENRGAGAELTFLRIWLSTRRGVFVFDWRLMGSYVRTRSGSWGYTIKRRQAEGLLTHRGRKRSLSAFQVPALWIIANFNFKNV